MEKQGTGRVKTVRSRKIRTQRPNRRQPGRGCGLRALMFVVGAEPVEKPYLVKGQDERLAVWEWVRALSFLF